MKIKFRSSYQKKFHYDLIDRDGSREIALLGDKREFEDPWGRRIWNYTREDFEREVNCSLGILGQSTGAVSREVLLAFKQQEHFERHPEYFSCGYITTGYFNHETGRWVRLFHIEPRIPERERIQAVNLYLIAAGVERDMRNKILAYFNHLGTDTEDIYTLAEVAGLEREIAVCRNLWKADRPELEIALYLTPGISPVSHETFDDIGGNLSVKDYLKETLAR